MKLSARTRRAIGRIIPFGIIWLLSGWVFLAVEMAAMGSLSPNLSTAIAMDLPIFIFASVAVFIVGLVVGLLEVVILAGMFSKASFAKKIGSKFLFYAVVLLIIIAITFPIAASLEDNVSLFDATVWTRFMGFIYSITFLSTMLQMGFSLLLCLIYSGISENLGHSVMVNFFTGKYHSPREEERIFMFLDMKSSTAAAEQLGHIRYFEMLKDYYESLSEAILDHEGEVYQYIGDEVVISWPFKIGIRHNNCVRCFYAMKDELYRRKNKYMTEYGMMPSFKAGIHYGMVTTGEIGALKKEIIFTGDTLNTTARIQSLCNKYKTDLLTSSALAGALSPDSEFEFVDLGDVFLRGKSEAIGLVMIKEAGARSDGPGKLVDVRRLTL